MAEEKHSIKSDTSGAEERCDLLPRDRAVRTIFTTQEKRTLGGGFFENFDLNAVDFSGADLRHARFVRMSLCGCDFSGSDLRGAKFIECDVREARFAGAVFGGDSNFKHSCFKNAIGLSNRVRSYIIGQGGLFWCC